LQALQDNERKHHLRTLCRNDLYFLLRYTLNRPDCEKRWLYDRCCEVESAPDGYLDLWAREHYKSTIITYARTIQDILITHGDDGIGTPVTVGIFSHTRPNAKAFLKQIKREFEGNAVLKEIFPDIFWKNTADAPKWSEDDGLILKRKTNQKEATIEAWGLVDGQPTGKHFSLLVYDDVVTRESVNTPEQIAKTTEALELSYALGAEGGARRFIGTRYHFNDSYKALIDRGTAKPRIHTATNDGTPTGEPVLMSVQSLKERRRDMGPYTFACQMLQNPVADNTQGFKRDWIKYHEGVNSDKLNVYILVDAASGKKKGNDYTAMWVIGYGTDGNVYVLDMVRDRLNLTERARRVMDLHRKWKPVRFGGVRYERYGLMADIEHLKGIMTQEGYNFEVTEVAGQAPKIDRIRRLIPWFEQGRIYLPRTMNVTATDGRVFDLVRDFIEEEYMAFPVSVHDDMLDALARLAEPDLALKKPNKEGKVETAIIAPTYGAGGWMT